jgi:DNA-directed RNA polymerase subunit RPC12/RpoP
MPIEFRCSHCGRLLRTSEDTAGRQAQCPECGTLTMIPGAIPPADAPPSLAPLGNESSPPAGGTSSAEPAYRPSASSAYQVTPDPFAAQRVSSPATGLIVTAILGLIVQVLVIGGNLAQMLIGGAHMLPRGHEAFPVLVGSTANVVAGLFGLALSILVLVGALKMKNLEGYSLAVTSAVLALIPCTSPCCLLGLPCGIWALIALNDSAVKAAFRS